jgi:hypothetical protein
MDMTQVIAQSTTYALFQCMLWSWYMANDTQFYVLGILLLLASVRCVPTRSLDDVRCYYYFRQELPEVLVILLLS